MVSFLLFVYIVLQIYLRMKVCLTISLGLISCDLCHCFAENENHLPVPPSMSIICMSHHQWHCFAENENHLHVPPSMSLFCRKWESSPCPTISKYCCRLKLMRKLLPSPNYHIVFLPEHGRDAYMHCTWQRHILSFYC